MVLGAGCDPALGPCKIQVRVPVLFRGNQDNLSETNIPAYSARWFAATTPPEGCFATDCGQVSVCGATFTFLPYVNTDRAVFTATRTASCDDLLDPTQDRPLSLKAYACTSNFSCRKALDVPGLDLWGAFAALSIGCPPEPPPEICDGDAQCTSCPAPGGNIGGGGPGGGGPGGPGRTGPGAAPRYAAGGAGHPGLPGSADWNLTLGRYWAHDYAQRIVPDPDDSHVWLITQYGTFREFGDLAGGTYETLAPSDEYRTLHRTGTGWELVDLDGTVMEFGGDGRWLSTTDRNDNAKTATYSGSVLTSVDFPDGRREDFGYHPSGKLASISEVGVGGTESRIWLYTWTGDDLTRIDRPDGTALEYRYDDPLYPGYLTRIELVGTDGTSRRVLRAYELDAQGNVAATWMGDTAVDGPDAVDVWLFSYDNESQTTVTDPLGQEIVYTYGRDDDSSKVKVTEIAGDCPSCGLGPNSTITYGDAAHPLLATQTVDGNGNVTEMTYDAQGQMISRTEAVGTGEQRTTTWTYDATYPGLVTEIRRPSIQAGADRVTLLGRDASGNVTTHEIRGYEAGQVFDCTVGGAPCYETVTAFNAAGQPETVDPPGYGTADVTTYAYDPARGDLMMASRTDPIVGTTSYDHDPFHRRTATTDPNGVTTETLYDPLDRVTAVIQRGASPAGDLVTQHQYDALKDLVRTILPEGNVIEYGHDAAGRLTTIERKPDAVTPGERTVYGLDAAGNRTSEQLQRWDPGTAAWVTESSTAYLYTTRCQLDQVLHPDGSITEHAFDCNGNLERTWDANHPSAGRTAPPTATYAYDALDRLVSVTRPWTGVGGGVSVTNYGFDVQDHLISVTDAEGSVTTYTYSDRDLLTQEISPVSGTTTYRFNPHGELVETTDARGITELRTVDELDRVTFVDYPGTDLDVTYTYDDPVVPFSLSRLTAITRDGHSVNYEFDRFGRVTRDSELNFEYDKNGNRTGIGYPDGVTATYTHDFADREATLTVTTPTGSTPVVTAASYRPSGPLSSLTFGTGALETRGFDARYFPQTITLAAATDRNWTYQTDFVGNITRISEQTACPGDVVLSNDTVTDVRTEQSCAALEVGPDYTVAATGDLTLRAVTRVVFENGFTVASGGKLSAGTDRSLNAPQVRDYAYQDIDYFLISADGPWWGSLDWTYDKIGNRLSETDNGLTDTYDYTPNGAGGNTALLSSIHLAVGGTRSFAYTPAGHQTQVNSAGNVVDFTFDSAGRLDSATNANGTAAFLYDGRSFLRQAGNLATAGTTTPTYDSSGLLHSLLHQPPGGADPIRYLIFYLAGRPVGQVALEAGQPERWWYLTTDHLGTPLVATDGGQADLWENRFGPFGEDMAAGMASGALENEIFLRFPGQWQDTTWQASTLGLAKYYNVWRWYSTSIGGYSRPDPLPMHSLEPNSTFAYVEATPLGAADPLGLAPLRPCSQLTEGPPPMCECDSQKVRQAEVIATEFARLYCPLRNSNQVPPGLPRPEEDHNREVGKIDPERGPVYLPRDPCLDWCTCEHERRHVEDLRDPRVTRMLRDGLPRQQIVNWLECRGYTAGVLCLRKILRGADHEAD